MHTIEPFAPTVPLLMEFVHKLPEGLLLCDKGLRVVASSGRARNLLYSSPVIEGTHLRELLPLNSFLAAPAEGQWILENGSSLQVRAVALPSAGWALYLREVGKPAASFVGESVAVRELLEFVSRIAASRAGSIIVEGESGTGKELIARRLHEVSHRAAGRFVAVNCTALPATLLESELFGHEKGAFTGAWATKEGLLEVADGGTFLLDEIGEMPLPLQAKLLRVLEDRSFRRLGGSQDIHVDLRIVAASNQSLQQAVEEKKFRADLYFRLNVVHIHVPALRERPEDIAVLARHFVNLFKVQYKSHVRGISTAAIRRLESYSWPGNVRELRNVIERAVLVESSTTITESSVSLPRSSRVQSRQAPQLSPLSLEASEKHLIAEALAKSSGNQSRAAALLGIGRFSLRYRMKKLGLR